jgi:putative PIN family toxin of toxin-antitoxin system
VRVVFDTNIFVSALVLPGSVAQRALFRVIDGRDHLIVSKTLIHELLDVLARKFSHDQEELARVAVFLADVAELVDPDRRVNTLPDDADNRVLEAAVAGRADAIVTGDQAMLKLGRFEGINIISLQAYLRSSQST